MNEVTKKKVSNQPSAYCKGTTKINRQLTARWMLLMGFHIKVVVLETGLGEKSCRQMCADLKETKEKHMGVDNTAPTIDGVKPKKTRTILRKVETILNNSVAVAEASLFLKLYQSLGGKKVKSTVDINALIYARRRYMQVRGECGFNVQSNRKTKCLTVNDCWVLAHHMIYLDVVSVHAKCCNESYFIAYGQSAPDSCPYCNRNSNIYTPIARPKKVSKKETLGMNVVKQSQAVAVKPVTVKLAKVRSTSRLTSFSALSKQVAL